MHPRTIKLAADGALELIIYGDIVNSAWMHGDTSARSVVDALAENPAAKTITVRINSFGGSAFDGVAIHNALKRHPANVDVYVDGIAASAASIVAMAGDRINMASGSMMMIHRASSCECGTASAFESAAQALRTLDAQMAGVYAARGNQTAEHFGELMSAETWLGASEAIALGIADAEVEALAMVAHVDAKEYGYRRVPAQFVAGAQTASPLAPAAAATEPQAPPAPRKDEPMSIKIVAQALGLQAEATESEVVAAAADFSKSKAKAKADADYRASVSAIVGADGDAALGAIKAHVEASAALATLKEEVDAIKAKAETEKHAALVKRGQGEGKLTASLVEHFSAKSAAELEAFLAVAPKAVPVGESHTAPEASDSGSGLLKHNGKAFAEMDGNERAALAKSAPDVFASMNTEYLASLR